VGRKTNPKWLFASGKPGLRGNTSQLPDDHVGETNRRRRCHEATKLTPRCLVDVDDANSGELV
jgi:hypothetical protein